ncbi:MAG: hypothetical protein COX20_01505, partial [Desulfobacterales bacterium CG23_combo_of_CG06-09_8_20_14_all_52_9]
MGPFKDNFISPASQIRTRDSIAKQRMGEDEKDVQLKDMALSEKQIQEKLKKLAAELDRKVFEIDEINASLETLNKNLTIQELVDFVLEKAIKLTGARIGSLCLAGKGENRLQVVASHGFQTESKTPFYIDLEQSIIQRVISDKKPLVVKNIETDPRVKKTNNPRYGSPSFAIIPI